MKPLLPCTWLSPKNPSSPPGHPTHVIESSTRHINNSNADEAKTTPIFNYSRVLIWSQSAEYILQLCENAAVKADQKITVQRRGESGINADGAPLARNWIGNEGKRGGGWAILYHGASSPHRSKSERSTVPYPPSPHIPLSPSRPDILRWVWGYP